jgi:hypothetical protein
MFNVKFCKLCKKPFDIGTNFDICPKCRAKKRKEEIYHNWTRKEMKEEKNAGELY